MEYKKIKMLKTAEGSPDGISIEKYNAGEEYDVNNALYKAFVIDMKIATPVNNVIEDIDIKRSIVPENKAIETSPSNKEIEGEASIIIDVPDAIEDVKPVITENKTVKKKAVNSRK